MSPSRRQYRSSSRRDKSSRASSSCGRWCQETSRSVAPATGASRGFAAKRSSASFKELGETISKQWPQSSMSRPVGIDFVHEVLGFSQTEARLDGPQLLNGLDFLSSAGQFNDVVRQVRRQVDFQVF